MFLETKNLVDCLDFIFWLNILQNISAFSSKIAQINLLYSTLIKVAGNTHQKTTNTIFVKHNGN